MQKYMENDMTDSRQPQEQEQQSHIDIGMTGQILNLKSQMRLDVSPQHHHHHHHQQQLSSAAATSLSSSSSSSSSRILYDIPCKVCTDHSSGKHYGIFACDGCAGFFKRSIRRNRQYVCKAKIEGSCLVDKTHRNQCRACRLRKCQAVGMNKDAVQHERGPRNSTIRRQMAIYYKDSENDSFSAAAAAAAATAALVAAAGANTTNPNDAQVTSSIRSPAASILDLTIATTKSPFGASPFLTGPPPPPPPPTLPAPPSLLPLPLSFNHPNFFYNPLTFAKLPLPFATTATAAAAAAAAAAVAAGGTSHAAALSSASSSSSSSASSTSSSSSPVVSSSSASSSPLSSSSSPSFSQTIIPIPFQFASYLNSENICESAARLLFMNVKWTKNLPVFVSLPFADQLLLLESSWRELFILGAAQFLMPIDLLRTLLQSNPTLFLRNLTATTTTTSATTSTSGNGSGNNNNNNNTDISNNNEKSYEDPNENLTPTSSDHRDLLNELKLFQEILAKFAQLQLDATEYSFLRIIVLFKTFFTDGNTTTAPAATATTTAATDSCSAATATATRPLKNPAQIASIREQSQLALKKYISQTYSDHALKFGKILVLVSTLRSISNRTIEELFFRQTIGNIPIEKIISDMYKSTAAAAAAAAAAAVAATGTPSLH